MSPNENDQDTGEIAYAHSPAQTWHGEQSARPREQALSPTI
jgi:hypothetical protein